MNQLSSSRRPPKFVRIVRSRPRLFMAGLLGLIVIAALPGWLAVSTRMLIGWDVGVGLYLIGAFEAMLRADIAHIRRMAVLHDEGGLAILVLTVAAAMASLGAIFIECHTAPGQTTRDAGPLALAVVTIVLSWAFIHTIFALHYAHEFHNERRHHHGGLDFPGEDDPDYWDFVYFSFVIGMTSQVSDVTITSKMIRRTATAHGVISFMFNAALLAITVNIAANAI